MKTFGLSLFSLGVILLVLLGCAAPVTRSLLVPDAPDQAYLNASRAMQRMGAAMTAMNPQQRMLSGTVKNAVVLNVEVNAASSGSVIHVYGKVLADKLAVGSMTEVDDYLALLR